MCGKQKRGEIYDGELGKDNSFALVLGLAPRKRSNKNLPPDVILKLTNSFQTGRDKGYWGNSEMTLEGTGLSVTAAGIPAPWHSE